MAKTVLVCSFLIVALIGCGEDVTPDQPPAPPPAAVRDSPTERPDVLLITVDTLRRDRLGCNGNARGLTPNLDALAREGINFGQAVADSSWTLPSVAALLTGRPARTVGLTGFDGALSPGVPSAGQIFAGAGFTTVAVVTGPVAERRYGFHRGFSRFIPVPSSLPGEAITEQAVQLLGELGHDTPVFLWLHYFDPHNDYEAPRPFDTLFFDTRASRHLGKMETLRRVRLGEKKLTDEELFLLRTLYDQEVAYVDAQIGKVIAQVRKIRAPRPVIVALTSDHGEEFLEHGQVLHGSSLHDELVLVPLLLSARGRLPANRLVERQVRNMDLLPTLMELSGMRPQQGMRGYSLAPMIRDEGDLDRPSFTHNDMTSAYEHYKEELKGRGAAHFEEFFALRTATEKLILARKSGRYQRYDLTRDPGELVNLYGQDGQADTRLRRQLEDWMRSSAPSETPHHALSPAENERLRALGYLR